MANTQDTFNGNGSNLGPFSFNFPWLESTDIKVSVNGELKTAGTHYNLQALNYSSKNGGEVLFTAGNAPGIGTGNIRVYRDTDDEELSATFYPGSAIRAQDLNDNFTQNLYVTQEIANYSLLKDGSEAMEGDLNMGNYRITNLAEPTADSNAATKQYIDTRLGSLDVPGFTRWSLTAVGGETTLSGAGTTGGTLAYSANREQVYLNGAQLQRDADYTANNGTSIVLNVALIAGDVVEVICVNNLNTGTTAQAQDVYWNQSGGGAVTRTVESKLRDVVSVKDFGAVGDGVTDDTAAVQAAAATGRLVHGEGLTYKTTVLPSDFSKFTKAAFKLGSVSHITGDFLDQNTSKITNSKGYTSWPQDKCYVVNNQIRVWGNFNDSHVDPDGRAVLFVSDDGGISYQEGELLDITANGLKVWSAGVDGTYEYVFGTDGTDQYMYKRTLPTQGSNSYAAFTKTVITVPTPDASWTTPVNFLHSFAFNGTNTIVCGVTSADGAWVVKSTDSGATWTAHALEKAADAEEPTVKWDSVSNRWCGFLRAGTTGNNPQFWIADASFSSINLYRAPAGYFGTNGMSDSPVPFIIDNGIIHAFASYRDGTLEGNADDLSPSAFYIKATLADGDNIWDHATVYRLGSLWHLENGGSSGCGVGSVVKYYDKIFLFYGNEERSGTFPGTGSTSTPHDRISNIYQTVIYTSRNSGVIDQRSRLVDDRSANNPLMRIGDENGMGWKAKEGRWVWSLSGQLSSAYPAARSNQFGDFIFDLNNTSGGITISSDSTSSVGYMVSNSYGVTGWFTDTSGNIRFQTNNSTKIRWDESAASWRPETNGTVKLGTDSRRWSTTYTNSLVMGSGSVNLLWTTGAGSPEGVVTAVPGSLYTNNVGGAGTTLYVKETGTGNTGWVAK
jgi:hypothetical protein